MNHFHLIVEGYRFHNIAIRSGSKEALWYLVHTHLNSILKARAIQNNDIGLYHLIDQKSELDFKSYFPAHNQSVIISFSNLQISKS